MLNTEYPVHYYNNDKLEYLFAQYKSIINFKKGSIKLQAYISIIESHFKAKVSCGSCAASATKAVNDFERVIFTELYRHFPLVIYRPNKELMQGTRFVNGMYETLVTSSFNAFGQLLDSFQTDYKGRRLIMTIDKYNEVYNELVKFNTSRYRYFESELYLHYLASSEAYNYALANPLPKEEDSLEGNIIDSTPNLTVKVLADATIKEEFKETEGKYKTQRKVNLEEAVLMKKNGMTNQEIADQFGVSKQAVGKLFKKHLDI